MKLPKRFPGGARFDGEFEPVPLALGQVWRKAGPLSALRIERLQLPGRVDYDGGLPGVSVRVTGHNGSAIIWEPHGSFYPAKTEADFLEAMRESGRVLCVS
jgi:hypothetical protein